MSASTQVAATTRELVGKSSKKLASANQIPAVLYGPGRETVSIAVDRHDFELWLAHHSAGSAVIELGLDGGKKPVNAMIREVHRSAVKGNVLHVDFMEISMDHAVHATVALHLINDPAGVKAGGVLTANFHELSVEAKPADIPSSGIELDVAGLEIGDSLHIGDIVAPAGVTILDDAEAVVVSVQAPRAEVEEVEAEVAEPEIIGAKSDSEE